MSDFRRRLAIFAGIVIAIIVLVLLFTVPFIVDQTEQALILSFGRPVRLVERPGLGFKEPWQSTIYYDKRLLDYEPSAEEVIAADQKRLVVDAYCRFKIANPLLFYQTMGTELVARTRLRSIISDSLRRVIGGVELQAVVSSKRAAIMRQIRDEVNNQAKSFGIDVVDVRIRRADLPEENSKAIYERMIAERQREAAQFRAQGAQQAQVIRAEADKQRIEIIATAQKQSQILRGDGEADSTRIYAQAYEQDPAFFGFYRSLEAYRDALTGANTTFVLSPQSEFFRYFDTALPPAAPSVPAPAASSTPPPVPAK
ncbi:MAG TPA: protease modulator HflC [Stellaceae bacterium]